MAKNSLASVSSWLGFDSYYLAVLKTQHLEKFKQIVGYEDDCGYSLDKHLAITKLRPKVIAYCDRVRQILLDMEEVLDSFDSKTSYGLWCYDIGISKNRSCPATLYISHQTAVFSARESYRDYISFTNTTLSKFEVIIEAYKNNK